ncbi:hypothetical protein AB0L13_37230 [Saccharopolyspora shandongensis]|uniref:hypothetical protein n=1 Tax=Saccharopolyspora shandongensis TaxID=418495 RepID=UPI00341FE424
MKPGPAAAQASSVARATTSGRSPAFDRTAVVIVVSPLAVGRLRPKAALKAPGGVLGQVATMIGRAGGVTGGPLAAAIAHRR